MTTFPCGGECGDIIVWFDDVAERVGAVQTETLRTILEANHRVEYLKKWLKDVNVNEMESSELESLFTSLVPLVSHADLEPYIQRIADGETEPLLTQEPITTLSLSSGTTEGRQKYIPFTSYNAKTTLQIFTIAAAYRSRVYPTRQGGKVLEFIYSSKRSKTSGGITVGTATTHVFNSREFDLKQKQTKSFTCSPQQVISIGDYKQSTYCHLLLGLRFSDQVEYLTSTFAYTIVQAFISFEEIWLEICNDIRDGTLSPKITHPAARAAVLGSTRPDPDLASRVGSKCRELEKVGFAGLVPKLWPNAKYVYSILTGSMEPYLSKLVHYAGGLPLVSADYGSTEAWIGVNVEPSLPPEKVSFAVVPSFGYYEFIPLYRRNREGVKSGGADDFVEGEAVPLSRVEVGQEYEVVLTTFSGLYRYRLGDVVQVSGFHRNTPKLSFVCRRKLILTVNIDKNTEKDLQSVVEKGSQILHKTKKAELIDFTSHASVAHQPGHYVIYWEIKGEADGQLLSECCTEMDASFVDPGYVVSRKSSSIGPLELRIVEMGTFKKIMDHFIGIGAGLNQFKTPRCTSNPVLLKILDACTVKKIRSTAYGLS